MPKARGNLVFAGIFLGVIALSFVLPPSSVSAFIVGFVTLYATIFGLQMAGRANIRELQAKDPHALETFFVEINEAEVRTGCAHIAASYPWSEFARVTEDNEFYLFVRTAGGGAALPKRILDGPAEQSLRACISAWAPDRGAGLAT
jgi:hypothetical protein